MVSTKLSSTSSITASTRSLYVFAVEQLHFLERADGLISINVSGGLPQSILRGSVYQLLLPSFFIGRLCIGLRDFWEIYEMDVFDDGRDGVIPVTFSVLLYTFLTIPSFPLKVFATKHVISLPS